MHLKITKQFLNHNFFPFTDRQSIKIRTVKRIFLKNWEQVKSIEGVKLLKTSLILDITNSDKTQAKLQPRFEILQTGENERKLQISLYEWVKIDDLINVHFYLQQQQILKHHVHSLTWIMYLLNSLLE